MTGEFDLPAERVLLTLRPEDAAQFGRLTGKMELQETDGEPDLKKFALRLEDIDLWFADLSLTSRDLDDLDPMTLNAKIETEDGRGLLQALQLEPVDIGYLGYSIKARRDDQQLRTQARLAAGDTVLNTNMPFRITGTGPVLRGKINSADLRIKDAVHTVQTINQFSQLKTVYEDSRTDAKSEYEIDVQPLVLPDDAKTEIVADLAAYQPLVLPENAADLAIENVINPEALAEAIDAEIDFDIPKITGQPGTSRLQSQLQMKRGHARLGPVDMAYGSGRTGHHRDGCGGCAGVVACQWANEWVGFRADTR